MDNKLSELSKPVAYDYNYAGCETCEGFRDWSNEISRERPPEWMIDSGKVKDIELLYSQEYVSALLAELEREQGMRAQNLEIKTLLAEKVKGLETKLWDSQQLVGVKSGSQIELRSQISCLEESNRKDMAWRGERLCELEDSLEAAQKRIAELERANQSQDDHINQQQDRIDSLEKTNTGLGRALGAAEKRLATPITAPDDGLDDCRDMWPKNCRDDFDTGYNFGLWRYEQNIRAAGFTVEGDA